MKTFEASDTLCFGSSNETLTWRSHFQDKKVLLALIKIKRN